MSAEVAEADSSASNGPHFVNRKERLAVSRWTLPSVLIRGYRELIFGTSAIDCTFASEPTPNQGHQMASTYRIQVGDPCGSHSVYLTRFKSQMLVKLSKKRPPTFGSHVQKVTFA